MDNLKKRTVTKFRIDPNIVDARVFEEGDEEEHPEEEDEDEDSLICCFCSKTMGKVLAYKECYSCGGEYHVACAWEAVGFKNCYGEGCEAKLSSMADLKGKVRRNGKVDYSSHSTSSSSSLSSGSSSEALAAGAPEEDRETDLVFDMDP
ncbi:hypothetical protein RHGRI_003219 [Rhododendron griersonianum]|uniref:Zinc finger PHD-type domain-containing protein n=1 Tax=Rhododendron griersonianum TaxID=479676 RepID=A0AAV6L6N9_9ERIC|nr:hypothetical protein RHGRI_003219 [Rhododendron griersonianum]